MIIDGWYQVGFKLDDPEEPVKSMTALMARVEEDGREFIYKARLQFDIVNYQYSGRLDAMLAENFK